MHGNIRDPSHYYLEYSTVIEQHEIRGIGTSGGLSFGLKTNPMT
jgi:hypothetical protein